MFLVVVTHSREFLRVGLQNHIFLFSSSTFQFFQCTYDWCCRRKGIWLPNKNILEESQSALVVGSFSETPIFHFVSLQYKIQMKMKGVVGEKYSYFNVVCIYIYMNIERDGGFPGW